MESSPTSTNGDTSARSFYRSLTLFGLALIFAIGVSYVPGIIVTGQWEGLVFAGLHWVIPALLGFLVWRFGSWAFWLTAVVSLLFLLITLPSISTSLKYPDSFYDFTGFILSVLGAGIAAVASVAGFFYERRHVDDREASRPTLTRTMQAVAGVLVVIGVISAILTVVGKDTVSEADKAGAVVIGMENTLFEPAELKVSTAQAARLLVQNNDPFVHTFTISVDDATLVNEGLTPGSEKIVSLAALAPGTYEFHCAVANHADMKGTVTIQ